MQTLPVLHADRLFMAYGVEARLPFLDLDVVTHALSLPAPELENPRTEKPVIRALYRRLLGKPASRKQGFTGAPRPENAEVMSWATDLAREGCVTVEGGALAGLADPRCADPEVRAETAWRAIVLEETARVLSMSKPPPWEAA
jgi:hypothetical protein